MSNRMYTDEELCWATQVAYCNVHMYDYDTYYERNGEYPTLQEVFNTYSYDLYYNQGLLNEKQEGDSLTMQQDAFAFMDAVKAGTICQGWRVVAVSNQADQEENGFYAVTIATSEKDAIVGFRGSESWELNQTVEDWVVADFTMLASELTEQEIEAGNYLYNTLLKKEFENYAVTGHSLGGNLSIVSTVLARNKDNYYGTDFSSRLKQTVSFDGPGHPTEFIEKYQTEIDQMADVMTHYQWSWVGSILTSLCAENGTYIKKESDKFGGDIKSLLLKHSTASLEFDEYGMLADSTFDPLAMRIHDLTTWVDDEKAVQNLLAGFINIIAVDAEKLCDIWDVAEEYEVSGFIEAYLDVAVNLATIVFFPYNAGAWSGIFTEEKTPLTKLKDSLIIFCEEAKNLMESDVMNDSATALQALLDVGDAICETIFYHILADTEAAPAKVEFTLWFLLEGIEQLAYITSPIGFLAKEVEYAYINYQDAKEIEEYEPVGVRINGKKVLEDFRTNYFAQMEKEDENLNTILESCSVEEAVTYRKRHVRMVHDNVFIQTLALNPETWNALSGSGDPFASLKESTGAYLATVAQLTANNSDPAVREAVLSHRDDLTTLLQETAALVSLVMDGVENGVATLQSVYEILSTINQIYEKASKMYYSDPLVLDMDRDGFEILDVEAGVYFDQDNSGLTEKTQWVDSDDALLALDLNGDGVINDGSELFGSSTVMADGSFAKTGFEALAQYDSNRDMRIDEQDKKFSEMLLWQDANTDGISQEKELYTLEQVGVESISLHSDIESGINSADVTMTDGTVAQMGEFAFASELYNTKGEDIEISEEIQGLPNVQAMGRVESLHTLIQLDETGTLKEYVTKFTQTTTRAEREQLVTDILYFITGANDVAEGSRGSEFDARKLHVIEQIMGRDFVGTAGSNPVNNAAKLLEEVYDSVFELYYNILNSQGMLKDYMDMTFWTTDAEGEVYLNTTLFEVLVMCEMSHGRDMVEIVGEMGRYIATVNKDNEENIMKYLMAYSDHSEYFTAIAEFSPHPVTMGTDEGETLSDGTLSSIVIGFEGEDKLYGYTGNDLLNGGAGDDYLDGGVGDDVYEYGRGYGNDTISNYSSATTDMDIVRLKELNREDVELEVSGNHLVVRVIESGETLTIENYFSGNCYSVEKLVFADGSEVNYEEYVSSNLVKEGTEDTDTISLSHTNGVVSLYGRGGDDKLWGTGHTDKLYGGEGDDSIYGNAGADELYGEAGDDRLYGQHGNDLINGGAGDDTLDGGAGDDVYEYGRGYGNDTISNYSSGSMDLDIVRLKELNREDVELEVSGNHLVVRVLETAEILTIENYFSGNCYSVEKLVFADGSEVNYEEYVASALVKEGTEEADTITLSHTNGVVSLYGRGGDDRLNGTGHEDKLYGGEGNDSIYGNAGADELYGEAGEDKLYGQHGNDLINGGLGDDFLDGGAGDDVYEYGRGYGNDIINNYSSATTDMDIVRLKELNREDVELEISGNHLVVRVIESGENLTIENYFSGNCYSVEKLVFADGSEVNYEEYVVSALVKEGTEEADTITLSHTNGIVSLYGRGGDDRLNGIGHEDKLYGGEGNDSIYGNAGADELYGETGDDKLYGQHGNDLINGGAGDDMLDGGAGDDVYEYGRGYGNDTISNYSSSSMDFDVLNIDANAQEVLFEKSGNNLLVSILGEADTLTIQNWYYGGCNQLEAINTSDGYTLTNAQVDQLIQAMASYESTSGMSWAEGVRSNDETVNQLVSQMWIKQETV